MKKVAMIPARLGSERIKDKNLRLLKGEPLVSYAIVNSIFSGAFDEIYLNSEAIAFRDIAEQYGARFYQRDPELAKSEVTNDLFAYDFLKNVKCDLMFQVLPTSPLLDPVDIKAFVSYMIAGDFDTLLSVKEERIEALFRGEPVNFVATEKMPKSQDLEPVKLFCNAIMGWRADTFINNFESRGCAVYGGRDKTGYFTLKGFSTIDIDNEEDFQLAELAIEQKARKPKVEYYGKEVTMTKPIEHTETDVLSILERDGVNYSDPFDYNKLKVNIQKIKRKFADLPSWSKRVINTENNSATLICQAPGEGNRLHYHPDWNEWWLIIDGEWEWKIEGEKITVEKGDIVFIPKNTLHRITAIGDKPAIRLAVSRDDIAHIYPRG